MPQAGGVGVGRVCVCVVLINNSNGPHIQASAHAPPTTHAHTRHHTPTYRLIVSAQAHLPASVFKFKQSFGTHYSEFPSTVVDFYNWRCISREMLFCISNTRTVKRPQAHTVTNCWCAGFKDALVQQKGSAGCEENDMRPVKTDTYLQSQISPGHIDKHLAGTRFSGPRLTALHSVCILVSINQSYYPSWCAGTTKQLQGFPKKVALGSDCAQVLAAWISTQSSERELSI